MTRAAVKARRRCHWARTDLAIAYHDDEWGVPVHDDRRLFEFLVLEGAQAGLSWETILRKRENYRRAFDNFDPRKVASYDAAAIAKLLDNEGIIRNRLKVASAVQNAKSSIKIQKEFGSFESRSEKARIQFRRVDDRLFIHAGGWAGKRSRPRLLSVPGSRLLGTHASGVPACQTGRRWQTITAESGFDKHAGGMRTN